MFGEENYHTCERYLKFVSSKQLIYVKIIFLDGYQIIHYMFLKIFLLVILKRIKIKKSLLEKNIFRKNVNSFLPQNFKVLD